MAYADREDLNYLGQLYMIGQNKTPFLNMIGGLQGGAKTSSAFNFPVAQPWSLDAASQNATSEALAAAAGTPKTYTRGQDYNTCQIMKYDFGSTFAKQSTFGEMAGLSLAGVPVVKDELAFQKMAALKQLAIDLEFSFLQGAYVAQNVAATVAKTRGMKNAIVTNEVLAAAGALTVAMVQELLREMAANGADFGNMAFLGNAYQIQALDALFTYAPEDRTIGGTNLSKLVTKFSEIGIVWAPQMPTDALYLVDMSVVSPVFCPFEGKIISEIETPVVAAAKGGFIYTQVGLDYGPEEFHGKITGLKDA